MKVYPQYDSIPRAAIALWMLSVVGCAGVGDVLSYARHPAERMPACVFRASNGISLPYRIYAPSEKGSLPMIVYLHGLAGRGVDNRRQLDRAAKDLYDYAEERGDLILLVPQCPENSMWGLDVLDSVVELSECLSEEGTSDSQHIYVTGFSMGGIGCWNLAMRRPTTWAGIMPVCAGPLRGCPCNVPSPPKELCEKRILAVCYLDDPVVDPGYSGEILGKLREEGSKNARFCLETKGGHTACVYREKEKLDWLIFGKEGLR